MNIRVWIKKSTSREKIIFAIIGLFILALFIQSAATLGLIRPLSADDFVVDSHDNVIVFSSFHYRIYTFSRQGRVISSFSVPEYEAPSRIAIDVYDNIYVNRGRTVAAYSVNGSEQRYSAPLKMTEDWQLSKDDKVVNLNKTMSHEYSTCSYGNRKPVKPGEFLFHEIKCDQNRGPSLDFKTSTKTHSLSPFWNDRVSVSDNQGRFLYEVTLTPIFLKLFAFPVPFLGILLILAAVYWIKGKIGGGKQRKPT